MDSSTRTVPPTPRHGPRRLLIALFSLCVLVAVSACAGNGPAAGTSSGGTSSGGTSGSISTSTGVTINVHILHAPTNGATLILLPVMIHGKGPFTFALDTGASQSVVDTQLADRLNLAAAGPSTSVSGVGGQAQSTPIQISNWHVGNLQLPKTVITRTNLPSSRRGNGIQGLVGSDIWDNFGMVTVNYNKSTVTVYKGGSQQSLVSKATSGSTHSVRLKILHGSSGSAFILAPVSIQGQGPMVFALDTGASVTIIDSKVANQLGLQSTGSGTSVKGVGGGLTATPIRVTQWHVGSVALPATTVTKGSLPSDRNGNGIKGLLGSDMWYQFGKITIDYKNSTLYLYKSF